MMKTRARSIKAAAIVAIGFLFAGMTATAASAQTGDLHASAVCLADGGDIALAGDCVSSQPNDKVEPGNWQDGQYECGATEVAITREIWTTTYKLNEQTDTWEAQAPVLTDTETSTRPLTPEEQAANTCDIDVTPTAPQVTPVCGPDNDTVALPTKTGVTYTSTGWDNNSVTITATAQEGYTISGTSSWTFTDEASLCPIELIDEKAITTVPTVVPICGPNNDTVTLPDTEGVIYTASSWLGGQLTVTAAAADESTDLVGDSSWTFTDTPVTACPDEEPAFSYVPSAELAQTGTSSTTLGLAALAMLLLTGGTVLVTRKMRA